ncbi:MAG: hypothetical protein HQL07_18530 [Nitrospirae bacterium]|nr:hypothetical protein [Magnetococcales bacterium]
MATASAIASAAVWKAVLAFPASEKIGVVGDTGGVYDIHLHFELLNANEEIISKWRTEGHPNIFKLDRDNHSQRIDPLIEFPDVYQLKKGELTKPILLDLDGNGITVVESGATGAMFDVDGDGYREWLSESRGNVLSI